MRFSASSAFLHLGWMDLRTSMRQTKPNQNTAWWSVYTSPPLNPLKGRWLKRKLQFKFSWGWFWRSWFWTHLSTKWWICPFADFWPESGWQCGLIVYSLQFNWYRTCQPLPPCWSAIMQAIWHGLHLRRCSATWPGSVPCRGCAKRGFQLYRTLLQVHSNKMQYENWYLHNIFVPPN